MGDVAGIGQPRHRTGLVSCERQGPPPVRRSGAQNPGMSTSSAPNPFQAMAPCIPCPSGRGNALDGAASRCIDVDGLSRPVENAAGNPIAPSDHEIRAFWRWFGDSRLVDGQGRPTALLHGTPFRGNLDVFDLSRSGSNTMADTGAVFFTDRPALAEHFAHEQIPCNYSSLFVRMGARGQVIVAYVRMLRPLDLRHVGATEAAVLQQMDAADRGDHTWPMERILRDATAPNTDLIKLYLPANLQKLREYGYDGFIAAVNPRHGGGTEYAVLDPSHIAQVSPNRGPRIPYKPGA